MAARNKRWRHEREKRDGGAFVAIPLSVLDSVAFREATPHAKALLMDLCSQLRADNNGDLSAAWSIMQERGWNSQTTLLKAKRELVKRGLIIETRMGARPNKASLYAVSWRALDECGGKLDIRPQSFERGKYRLMDPIPAIGRKA